MRKNHVINWRSNSQNRLEHPFPVTENKEIVKQCSLCRQFPSIRTRSLLYTLKQYDFTNTPTHTSRLQQIAIIFPIERKTIQRCVMAFLSRLIFTLLHRKKTDSYLTNTLTRAQLITTPNESHSFHQYQKTTQRDNRFHQYTFTLLLNIVYFCHHHHQHRWIRFLHRKKKKISR